MKTTKDILSFITGGKTDVYNAVIHYRLNAGAVEIIEAYELQTDLANGAIHTVCHLEDGKLAHSFGDSKVQDFYSKWRKTNKVHQCNNVNEMLKAGLLKQF